VLLNVQKLNGNAKKTVSNMYVAFCLTAVKSNSTNRTKIALKQQ
jgi:hypothetical protein